MRSARAQLVTGTVQSRPTHHHARADTLPWLLLPGGQASKCGAQRLLLEAHGAGSSGGTGRPPGPHASPRWAAQCPVRPHAQGPQEAFHPDSPAYAHQPPAGAADQLLGAWCGSHPSRSMALRGRPGLRASGLGAKTAEPPPWALVMDTQGTHTDTSPLDSTPPSTAQM